MFGKIPLALVGLVVGAALTAIGFIAYADGNSTLNLVGFFYGVPILLGGAALKAAELKPVPFKSPTSASVLALREAQATATQNQVRKDVTRFRYGQEVHLEVSLDRLGLSPTDEERPTLVALEELERDGRYALQLEFESALMPFEKWQERREKIERFFGPNVRAELAELDGDRVALTLVSVPAETPAAAS